MGLPQWLKKLNSDFRTASKLDQGLFILALLVAAGLLFEHGFVHTGIVKFSVGKERESAHAETKHLAKDKIMSCDNISDAKVYVVEIKDNVFSPAAVEAEVCDRLRFVNRDKDVHEPAFGDHPSHQNYPGYIEKGLLKDESSEFVLGAAGVFLFHDHLNEKIEGSLTVNR